jgi:flagellar hook-associated protein 2
MTDSLGSFSGISSGFDYRSLVDAIIASEHKPVDTAQAQIDAATRSQTALKSFHDLLTTLRTALGALRDGTAFDTLKADVAGTGVGGRTLLTATAGAGAQPGSYQVEVVSLARAQKLSSTPVADASAALSLSGDFTLNGVTVSVDAADSLLAIRDKINAANTGATPTKVTASILTVGPGDSRLILTSDTAGSTGIAHADGAGGVLAGLGLTGGGEVLVAGSDAVVKIDDIAVTRGTNVIADAIPGVTLALQAEEPGTKTTVTLTQDTGAATAAVKAFVDAYNALGDFLRTQQTAAPTLPPLYGDSALRLTRAGLSRGILGIIAGDTGNLTTGSVVGLSISKTGALSLDETKLTAALGGNPAELRSLFADGTGGAGLDTVLGGLLDTNTGTVDLKNTALTERISTLQGRIADIESRLDHRRSALLAQFAQMEATISTLQSQSSFLSTQSTLFSGQSTKR